MDKKLLWRGSHKVLGKASMNLRMKSYWLQNFSIETWLRFLVVAFKERRKCLSMNTCPTKAWTSLSSVQISLFQFHFHFLLEFSFPIFSFILGPFLSFCCNYWYVFSGIELVIPLFFPDHAKGEVLDWPKRFNIICGISRGLVYLHQDSRLRIIHRDLKASNVLLDSELNPKISDFGLARTFGGNQTEGNTRRVVGT